MYHTVSVVWLQEGANQRTCYKGKDNNLTNNTQFSVHTCMANTLNNIINIKSRYHYQLFSLNEYLCLGSGRTYSSSNSCKLWKRSLSCHAEAPLVGNNKAAPKASPQQGSVHTMMSASMCFLFVQKMGLVSKWIFAGF